MIAEPPVEKVKFPRAVVSAVLEELLLCFDPEPGTRGSPAAKAERICAVGGYRRRKSEMKDLELLFIPRVASVADPADMFGATRDVDLAEGMISAMVAAGRLEKRLKEDGSISAWGRWNKHARHVASGLPIDLFAATRENWWNRMVVTTGPMESNVRIAKLARERKWEWEVGEAGFVPLGGTWAKCPKERRTMRSEAEVFAFVDLPFLRPEDRR